MATQPATLNDRSVNRTILKQIYYLLLYVSILLMSIMYLPQSAALYYEERAVVITFGVIGTWRYLWWLNHVVRSFIYGQLVFPARRLKANQLWKSGWRPNRLIFMMTTFQELKTTTETVLQSVLDECDEVGVPVKLFIGTGTELDELIIEQFFSHQNTKIPFDVIFVRQKKPGKRYAIGETMRAILRHGLTEDDSVVFMDGDTYFETDCLKLCLPFFKIYSKMQALTTNERAIVKQGPLWVNKWLDMRFAQRHFTMKSHALSNKVLTLTGRMSIFRGKHLLELGFIHIIENDHLHHWLWGDYRFLSGDDKSTWYYLLKQSTDMFYIPDATTITIEYIHGSAFNRMKENLRRWNGNTLRNGARAIALGPRTVGYFIWWCLIDQRCAIWTMFIGHMSLIIVSINQNVNFLLISFIWIALSRLCNSCVLFIQTRQMDMSFPFLLYLNQLLSTVIKIYILFRLPQQRWKNRGDQRSNHDTQTRWKLRSWIASYLTIFYCVSCLLGILVLLKIVSLPTFGDIKVIG